MPAGEFYLRGHRQPDCSARGRSQTATEGRSGAVGTRASERRQRQEEGSSAGAKQGAGSSLGTRAGGAGSVQFPASVRSLLGTRQGGEPQGMGAGDELCRYGRLRFRRSPLPVVPAGGGRRLRGGHRRRQGTRAAAEDGERLRLVRRRAASISRRAEGKSRRPGMREEGLSLPIQGKALSGLRKHECSGFPGALLTLEGRSRCLWLGFSFSFFEHTLPARRPL